MRHTHATDSAGRDLANNHYYEFRSALSERPRRIVYYARRSVTHHSDAPLTPAWLQWLRHARPDAPSMDEQAREVARQGNLKQLAAAADARWAAKPSVLDRPADVAQPAPLMAPRDKGGYVEDAATGKSGVMSPIVAAGHQGRGEEPVASERSARAAEEEDKQQQGRRRKPSPWDQQQRGAPGQEWQPKAWTPGQAAQRR